MHLGRTGRRLNVITRLETQLKTKDKTIKKSFNEKTSLSEVDVKRIAAEIAILKAKI